MVLLCCTEPTSDLQVALDYTSDRLASGAPPERRGTITVLDELTPGVFRLTLQLVPDDVYGGGAEFSAGQFCQLEAPGTGVLRAYSMANIANWDGELEFLIHVIEGGLFTGWLSSHAAVGDELRVVGPQGTFGLVENGMRPRWFLGGGCGFAPLRSMLLRMAEWGDPQQVRLYFGVNTEGGQFADGDISELLGLLPQLEVTSCVWTPAAELPTTGDARWCRMPGTSVDAFVDDVLNAAQTPDIYVCGPPAMVAALEARLDAHGIDPSLIHAERISEN
jgi:ferredoxin-NADP reductase